MKEILHDVTRHMPHWASLIGIIVAAFLGFLFFAYDQVFQSAIMVSAGVAFVIWGIVHHWLHEDLHPKVVLEYIATALVGTIILLSLIWR